jgi:hypothetical protein
MTLNAIFTAYEATCALSLRHQPIDIPSLSVDATF